MPKKSRVPNRQSSMKTRLRSQTPKNHRGINGAIAQMRNSPEIQVEKSPSWQVPVEYSPEGFVAKTIKTPKIDPKKIVLEKPKARAIKKGPPKVLLCAGCAYRIKENNLRISCSSCSSVLHQKCADPSKKMTADQKKDYKCFACE